LTTDNNECLKLAAINRAMSRLASELETQFCRNGDNASYRDRCDSSLNTLNTANSNNVTRYDRFYDWLGFFQPFLQSQRCLHCV